MVVVSHQADDNIEHLVMIHVNYPCPEATAYMVITVNVEKYNLHAAWFSVLPNMPCFIWVVSKDRRRIKGPLFRFRAGRHFLIEQLSDDA